MSSHLKTNPEKKPDPTNPPLRKPFNENLSKAMPRSSEKN